jgi:hypothetical protein
MKQEIINTVEILRKKGDYQYILSRYVDDGFWMNSLQKHLQGVYVENFTDFNYATCFTMYLNISSTNVKVGTEEFINFVKQNHNLYRIMVQISAIAPYAIYKFVRYTFDNGEIKMSESFVPFIEEHDLLGKKVSEFLALSGLQILDEEMLLVPMPDISLEMKESNVTVYNCLFEDGY